jgi:hypothetical protein
MQMNSWIQNPDISEEATLSRSFIIHAKKSPKEVVLKFHTGGNKIHLEFLLNTITLPEP